MARNYIQPGHSVTIPAPASVLAGSVVVVGELAGVAQGDALSGAALDLALEGVWRLPKAAADSFAIGAPVYWNAVNQLVTTTASGNTRIGVAVSVAPAGASIGVVSVRLGR